jgi:hypothetical protein
MYFSYVNGGYQEDPNGILVGLTGDDDSGNKYKAIVFMLNFTSLQYAQSIDWIYQVEMQALGRTDWLFVKNVTMTISNSNYVNTETGAIVPASEATTTDENGVVTINDGYARQLDFFVEVYLKTEDRHMALPMYDYFMSQIEAHEGIHDPLVTYKRQ